MTTSNQTLNMAIPLRSKHHKNDLMRLQSIMEEQQPSLTDFVQSMIKGSFYRIFVPVSIAEESKGYQMLT